MNEQTVNPTARLRPKERVIKRLADSGMSEPEIAWRFKSSPRHIQRTLRLIEIPRSPREDTGSSTTTALERTVLKARNRGASHAEIGSRLRRSPGFVARVEQFAALRAENSSAGSSS